MANSKKTKKSKAADLKKMTADIEAKVEVKKLLKDERSHKIAGTILILISILLFLSFSSYLFTWQEDQSKVFKGAKILLPSHAESMANLLGTAGAYFSDLFFRSGFGIASYLFCTFFFIVGVNLFAPKKIFSVSRNIRYVIAGLLVISVCASFLMHTPHSRNASSANPEFFWGGKVGDMLNEWLQQEIGYTGTAALLFVGLLSYIIWRFNPSFNFQHKKKYLEETFFPKENEETISDEDDSQSLSGVDLFPLTTNPAKEETPYNHEFNIVEKDEIPVRANQPLQQKKIEIPVSKKDNTENGLTLEVKNPDMINEHEN